MHRTAVINVVGLTPNLLGPNTPFLLQWATEGQQATVTPVLPAVTTTAQSTYLTGKLPTEHGIVANGWYFRDECEVKLWRQSNHLVQAPKVWDLAKQRNPDFTCANMFWWYNMYSSVDIAVTPRPMYPANGLKLPDVYSQPPELRHDLQGKLGTFPLFQFWGPATSIKASQWIAQAAMAVEDESEPTLNLVYLPHLDYNLQRIGPNDPRIAKDLREIDAVCEELITFLEMRGVRVLVLSEYGISPVHRPIHINRALRDAGLIALRDELGRELLDAGECEAFAVADHQIAHVYVRDPDRIGAVKKLLEGLPGIETVLDEAGKVEAGLAHPRAGELVAIAEPDAWFTYYYWLDDARAPDFARTVDIHRKPGYDPVELFTDPVLRAPKLRVGRRLIQKKLGFRYLMDVIPLEAGLVRGSHGHVPDDTGEHPVLISQEASLLSRQSYAATDVQGVILDHIFGR